MGDKAPKDKNKKQKQKTTTPPAKGAAPAAKADKK